MLINVINFIRVLLDLLESLFQGVHLVLLVILLLVRFFQLQAFVAQVLSKYERRLLLLDLLSSIN